MQDVLLTPEDRRRVLDFGLSLRSMPVAEAWERLAAALASLGFGRLIYCFIPDLAQGATEAPGQDIMTFLSTQDEAFLAMYRQHRVHLHCASVHYVTRHEAPTLMSPIIAANLASEALPLAYRDWLRDYNVRTRVFDGVLVPLRGPVFSAFGCMSMLVDPSFDAACATHHARRHLGLVSELTHAFHRNIEHAGLLPRQRRLTPREREILLWLAKGFVTKQIAAKTGTSVSTIEKQLARARWRLSAGNNTNLLLKAMAYGLI